LVAIRSILAMAEPAITFEYLSRLHLELKPFKVDPITNLATDPLLGTYLAIPVSIQVATSKLELMT